MVDFLCARETGMIIFSGWSGTERRRVRQKGKEERQTGIRRETGMV